MNHSKYVVVKSGAVRAAIIFPSVLTHKMVAERVAHGLGFEEGCGPGEIVSAGFVSVGAGTHDEGVVVKPYGKSISLGIGSSPEDVADLEIALGLRLL